MIRVGVTQRTDYISDRKEYRDTLDQRMIQWLQYCEFIPIPIPNDADSIWLQHMRCNAFVLSGGGEI